MKKILHDHSTIVHEVNKKLLLLFVFEENGTLVLHYIDIFTRY